MVLFTGFKKFSSTTLLLFIVKAKSGDAPVAVPKSHLAKQQS